MTNRYNLYKVESLKVKRNTYIHKIYITIIHSVIHLLILSGSQSVSQLVNKSVREACAVGIVFWIRSEIGYRKPHITPLFPG